MITRIVIPLIPEGKRRHRSRVVRPKDKTVKPWVQEYPDPEQNKHLEDFSRYLRWAFRKNPSENPILLGVTAFMPIPKSKSEKWKAAARAGKIRPVSKPDLSNIIKLVEDIGNGILWKDDSQICGYLQAAKFYSDSPKYVLTIQELSNDIEADSGGADRQLSLLPILEQEDRELPVKAAAATHERRVQSMGNSRIVAFERTPSRARSWRTA